MKTIRIGNKQVYDFCEPMIIADIGANFNGDLEIAKKMILKAKEAGIDAVKFQSWTKESLMACELYEGKPVDMPELGHERLDELLDFLSITESQLREMKKICNECGVIFSSTPFSETEVDALVEMDVPFIKIASMDLNNLPFIHYVAKTKKPLILSTGMGTIEEIQRAVETVESAGNDQLVLLHCTALYPPLDSEVNLNNIECLRESFDYPLGYSDHTTGFSIPLAAVAKGACIIEKHYTLDKTMPGWDHAVSATPEEFKIIAEESKRISRSLGNKKRSLCDREIEQRNNFRRSIVAKGNISAGHILTVADIDCKRPGTGIAPTELEKILGREVKKDIKEDELIKWDNLK